jgi:hypothetical protein
MSKDILEAAGFCPCCGQIECSTGAQDVRRRLKAKLEARRKQLEPCCDESCNPQQSCFISHDKPLNDLDTLVAWIDARKPKKRANLRCKKTGSNNHHHHHHPIGLPMSDCFVDEEIERFAQLLLIQGQKKRDRVCLLPEARCSLICLCASQLSLRTKSGP